MLVRIAIWILYRAWKRYDKECLKQITEYNRDDYGGERAINMIDEASKTTKNHIRSVEKVLRNW